MDPIREIDLSITYNIKETPDIKSGRCDNCDTAKFKSSVKKSVFLRECRNCGMKKIV
jgi:RNase P subunit RPR2